jgi:O-antigen ligase
MTLINGIPQKSNTDFFNDQGIKFQGDDELGNKRLDTKTQEIAEKQTRLLNVLESLTAILLAFMLIFLVVLAQSVNVAAGGIFLLAIFFWFNKKKLIQDQFEMPRYGYFFITGLLGCFFVSLTSFFFAADESQVMSKLDLPLRYLLFIPCFLMFCHLNIQFKPLLIAASIGSVFASLIAVYQYHWLGIHNPVGAVSHRILFGCFSVVLTLFSLISFFVNRSLVCRILGAVGFFGGLVAIFLSGSRCAWIGFFVCILMLLVIWIKIHPKRSLILGSVFLVLASSLFTDKVAEKFSSRFLQAKTEMSLYSHQGLTGNYSVGLRLEMWKAALIIFAKNPILGSGPRSFERRTQQLIDSGSISAYAKGFKHAHNDYLTVLASRGILGLIFFLAVIVLPVFLFLRSYQKSTEQEDVPALFGLVVSVTYMIFGLSETMFDRMMSVMLYLLLVSLCLSQCYFFKNPQKINA